MAEAETTDLLGFGDSPQQGQPATNAQHLEYSPTRGETTYINASTVAISTSGTPTIVGLCKIEPSAATNNNNFCHNNGILKCFKEYMSGM